MTNKHAGDVCDRVIGTGRVETYDDPEIPGSDTPLRRRLCSRHGRSDDQVYRHGTGTKQEQYR
jgi:hypothetical protein